MLNPPTAGGAGDAAFLRIERLVKDFDGYKAVNDVSLDIAKGEIFALLGSSGCGKSTLLRMLAGFETPTSGRIVLAGQDLAALPPYQRPMNMMFQSYALFPHLSVWDNIAFGLRRDGLPRDQVADRVEAMLKLVQLGKFAKRKPHQLSGGQQQRVALARSLAKQPQLLLLDEPLGALDKKLREETQIELVNIIESVGVTCVMVTHDQEEAMTMASRIAIMSEGRFLQVGAPAEIYETPATRFVADFIGNVNLMDGTLDVDAARPRGHRLRRLQALRRPRHHRHRGHGGDGGAAPGEDPPVAQAADDDYNSARGTIKELSYFGSFTVYHLELPSGARLKVSQANVQRHRDDEFTWGDVVWAHWSRSAHVVLTPMKLARDAGRLLVGATPSSACPTCGCCCSSCCLSSSCCASACPRWKACSSRTCCRCRTACCS